MKKIVFVFVLGSVSALSRQLDYTVIQATGKFCPGRDSCRQHTRNTRGPDNLENDWKRRNCFCDDDCETYGDCCLDAAAYNFNHQSINHRHFKCLNLKQYGDVYIRTRCDASWPLSKDACEVEDEAEADPLAKMPVTSIDSGITYKNFHCAVCNSDAASIQFWRPRLECPTLTGYFNRFKNVTDEFVSERMRYDADRRKWGIDVDAGDISVFHECYVDPAVPDNLVSKIRPCSGKNLVIDCPENYEDEETAFLCSAYTALVFEPNAAYRNVHCAMCNNADLNKLICLNLGPFGRFNWQQNFNSYSFAVLLDFNGSTQRCAESGFVFDPFFKTCRNVICPNDGVFQHGKCVIKYTSTSSTTTTSTTTTTLTTTTEKTLVISTRESTTLKSSTTISTTTTSTTTSTSRPKSLEFKECPKVQLKSDEYEVINETRIKILKADKMLDDENFDMSFDSVTICVINVQSESKFGFAMALTTLICLGISVICCILHILATTVTPELRNLSGKNLLSLTFALLGGYLSFIASMLGNEVVNCFVLAAFMYFFFTASFAWMAVISADVFRSLRLATTQLRLTSGSQWKKFALYSTLAWSIPLILTSIAIGLDFTESDFRPQFGLNGLCWFGNKRSLFVMFAAPFVLVIAANVAFFIMSARMVSDTSKDAKQHRTNFRLYLRLAVIMGVTWISGIIAAVADLEPLWFIFVALNALQGLFIFLAFSCNRKVLDRLSSLKRPGSSASSAAAFVDKSATSSKSASTSLSSNASSTKTTSNNVRAKTMYTVPKHQANCDLTQNSFDGRFY